MTQNQIISMAREAGFHKWYTQPEEHPDHVAIVERFAALVAAAKDAELRRLHDELELCCQLKREYQEQAVAAITQRDARQPAPEPVAWLVMDEGGYVQHAASWRDAAHEHINDAINEHDLVCARTWRVVPAYTAPPQQPEPVIDKSMAVRIATQLGWVPNQRKPLDEEDVRRILCGHRSLRQVIRATELAHGIKE